MGAFCKAVDALLFLFFAVMAVASPLIDSQAILPDGIYPAFLVDLKRWYIAEVGDYMLAEKPHFLVGIIWHELLVFWPLSIANIYAFLAGKWWFGTSSLICGASLLTSMAAILGEMIGSGKASEKLLMIHLPFLGFGFLALLRGLFHQSNKTRGSGGKRPAILARRKHA